MTRDQQIKKAREAQKRAAERRFARQCQKMQDPEYIEEQRNKQRAMAERQRAKRIEKVNSPEYRLQNAKKQEEAKKRSLEKAKAKRESKPADRTKVKPKSSRGLKGRSPTALEAKIMNALCELPCLACKKHGRDTPLISYHHIDGRTKPLAHAKGLPLCAHHHDTPADKDVIAQYPDLIPIHARGTIGGRAAWEVINGTQEALLKWAYELAELDIPDGLFS